MSLSDFGIFDNVLNTNVRKRNYKYKNNEYNTGIMTDTYSYGLLDGLNTSVIIGPITCLRI